VLFREKRERIASVWVGYKKIGWIFWGMSVCFVFGCYDARVVKMGLWCVGVRYNVRGGAVCVIEFRQVVSDDRESGFV